MKKQLLIAAVAATMSVAGTTAFADISIKGDAHLRYANIDGGGRDGENSTAQRVRLHVTGTSGDTTVKLGLRNDGGTRVSGGSRRNADGVDTGSLRGNPEDNSALNTDYLFLTTKIGALNIKAGDWWDTTGLGLARKGRPYTNVVQFGTKFGDAEVHLDTGADQSGVTIGASTKVNGWNLMFEHDTANEGYTDVAVKGKAGAIGAAAEYFTGKSKANDANKLDGNAYVVHLWTKAKDITWHIATAKWDAGVQAITGNNSKFSPLGVSILGSAPGVNGKLALGNVNSAGDGLTGEGIVAGVRADLKLAGMGVQVAAGNLEVYTANASIDEAFWDIIVTRPLGKGSDIKLSIGDWNDSTSAGAKISVKF